MTDDSIDRPSRGRATGRVTMADVAALSGVSAITVSRALRHPDKVSPETRAKVQAAIDTLGYVPDLVAGSLASNQSHIVAAVVPTIGGTIFVDTVKGMADALREQGYQLLLGDSGYSLVEEAALVDAFLGRRPNGLILTGVHHEPSVRTRLAAAKVPVVEVWDVSDRPIDMVVGFSNFRAGYEMTAHLARRGYRKIGFAAGLTFGDQRSTERRRGYRTALEEFDLGPERALEVPEAAEFGRGREALVALLARYPDIDAAFFSSDVLAVGALFECQRRGWPVPDRIAIAGFGDFGIAAETIPALTTVRIPGREIGQRAAGMLLDRFAGGGAEPGTVLDLGFEVVARASA
ncbi:MAG: LacI family transcriptional regulator [Rhodospirillaceae bacterium]|nr:LacI family transcriptional regulator [Rhodospirillaceae bacterium]